MKKYAIIFFVLFLLLFSTTGVFAKEDTSQANVYVVQIDDTIDATMADLLNKAIETAKENHAELLIVEVNTYGGYIDSAITMKDAILSAQIPVVTYVNKQALSAGALISVAGEKLYMSKGSSIGAAEARIGDEKADEKTMSAWVSELRSTAEARGKDPNIMAAMADDTIAIEGVIEEGRLLTLSDSDALKYGISDGTMASYETIANDMGVEINDVSTVEASFLEKFASFVTNPVVSGILISMGILGILFEVMSAGLGLGIVVGLGSFALYFAGHIVLDSLGWTAVICFALGMVLLLIEALAMPGFGVAGVGGLLSIFAGVFLLSPSWQSAVVSVVIAVVVALIVVVISMKSKKTNSIWRKFVLRERTDEESGYTSPNMDNVSYLGKSGVSLTPLRPAGQVEIEGNRVDVVTEGDFLDRDVPVVVCRLDGTRIVVRPVKD